MEEIQTPDLAQNSGAVEDNSQPTSPVDELNTSGEAEESKETEGLENSQGDETKVDDSTKPERQQERPAERRIRQLVDENKRLHEENSRRSASPIQPPQTPKLSQLLQGRDEITPAELDVIGQQFAAQASGAAASLEVQKLEYKLQQKEAVQTYESDTREIEHQYPELNPESDQYNPVLERKVADAWKKLAVQKNPYNPNITTINPSVRLTDVAKDYMEVAHAAAESGKATASANLAKNADHASLRPGGESTRSERDFKDLSYEEMERTLRKKGHDI